MREVLDVGPGGLHPVQATAPKEHAAKVGQCTSCPGDGALIQLQLSREKGTPGIRARKWGIRSRR